MAGNGLATVAEMAKELNCSTDTIIRMIRSGRIPHLRLPGSYRMDPEKVILALSREPEGES